MTPKAPPRDYAAVLARAASTRPPDARDAHVARMHAAADLLWDAFSATGLSWIGFYTPAPPAPGAPGAAVDEMILGPRRDKPACSPIGLHGCCGRSFREQKAILVDDVATLGANYVACDPRDRAELVLPLFEPTSGARRCWGVLDADSHDTHAFTEADLQGMHALMHRLNLTDATLPPLLRL